MRSILVQHRARWGRRIVLVGRMVRCTCQDLNLGPFGMQVVKVKFALFANGVNPTGQLDRFASSLLARIECGSKTFDKLIQSHTAIKLVRLGIDGWCFF